jgi:hypothetical protein
MRHYTCLIHYIGRYACVLSIMLDLMHVLSQVYYTLCRCLVHYIRQNVYVSSIKIDTICVSCPL